MRRRQLLATGALTAVAGCLSHLNGGRSLSGQELIEDAREARSVLTDLTARRTIVLESPEETIERTEKIHQRPPNEKRLEVLESTDTALPAGAVSVRKPLLTTEYDPVTETAIKQHHPNRIVNDKIQLQLESLLEEGGLEYVETETVDGRDAHLVETKPDEDVEQSIDILVGDTTYQIPLAESDEEELEEAETTRAVWLDDEYQCPIKEETSVVADGDVLHRVTATYTDLKIDSGIPDAVFEYEPPETATVRVAGTEPIGVFETREEAAEITPYPLPEPDVPSAYTRDRITVVEKRDFTTTTFWYVAGATDPDETYRVLSVAVRDAKRFDTNVLEEVVVDGQTKYYREGNIESLFWVCSDTDLTYEVSSQHDTAAIEPVAASIGCPL